MLQPVRLVLLLVGLVVVGGLVQLLQAALLRRQLVHPRLQAVELPVHLAELVGPEAPPRRQLVPAAHVLRMAQLPCDVPPRAWLVSPCWEHCAPCDRHRTCVVLCTSA